MSMGESLTEFDRSVLEFLSAELSVGNVRLDVIPERFGVSEMVFWDHLATLIRAPAAEAQFPFLVRRLQRLCDRRRRYRTEIG